MIVALAACSSRESQIEVQTKQYYRQCIAALSASDAKAEKLTFRSQKIDEWKRGVTAAEAIIPGPQADSQGVTLMREYLHEASDFLKSTNGEWAAVRGALIGSIGAAADFFGASGMGTSVAVTMVGAETSDDITQQGEFEAAQKKLDFYMKARGWNL